MCQPQTSARLSRTLRLSAAGRPFFVQFLAGSRELRTGVLGFLLQLIAWISLVIGPIGLLVFFQLQFLPYHNEAISWWHRIAVLADIALLWTLWPSIARGETAGLAWRDLRRVKILALAFASLAPVLLVTTIATFPGEWLEDTLPSKQIIPWKDGSAASTEPVVPTRASLRPLPVLSRRARRTPRLSWPRSTSRRQA